MSLAHQLDVLDLLRTMHDAAQRDAVAELVVREQRLIASGGCSLLSDVQTDRQGG